MRRKVLLLLLLFVLIGGSLFAVAPKSWVNASVSYDWFGSSSALGIDASWMGFPGRSWIGMATRAGVSLSLDASSSFTSMFASIGPAFSVDFTEGILGYASVGTSYVFTAYTSPSAFEHLFGIDFDLGARFRIMGSESGDLALVTGASGNIPLLDGVSLYRVSAYVGFSYGSKNFIPW